MWLSLVRNTEWSAFLDMVSPSFFEVLPPSALRGQAKELISNYVTRPRFIRVREDVASLVERSGLPITMRGALPRPRTPEHLSAEQKRERGEAVLRLFFHQLLRTDTPILDLRAQSFGTDGDRLIWNPAPLYLKWEPDFLPHARDLYMGLFTGEDARFKRAVEALSLQPAEDILKDHFGKTTNKFSLAEFQQSFHQAFLECRDAGKTLHGNFLPFGLYLACLYEHLGTLGDTFDVGAALRFELQSDTRGVTQPSAVS